MSEKPTRGQRRLLEAASFGPVSISYGDPRSTKARMILRCVKNGWLQRLGASHYRFELTAQGRQQITN